MSKKYDNAIEMLADFLEKKFEENQAKGYRGLGLLYSGLWSLCKKYSGISSPELLTSELNKVLEPRGYKIVPDKRAKIKMVRVSKSDEIKKELENEFEEFLKMRKRYGK